MDLKARWAACCAASLGGPDYWRLAPVYVAYRRAIVPLLERHARGRLLDVGAGQLALRELARPYVRSYFSLDLAREHPELSVQASVFGLPFAEASFDTVILTQVLEHVPEPAQALAEVARVLRPGGKLIVSVPHLAYLHAEPHDYYRFTVFGLRHLLGRAGLKPLEETRDAGLATFLCSVPAIALAALCQGRPALLRPALAFNRLLASLALGLDRRFDGLGRFAINRYAVAAKIAGNPPA